jgi:NADH-quinone oxidoreductase subunit N
MDALIVIFVSGIVAMFLAMTQKPLLVLATALVGLSVGIVLMVNQWYNPYLLFEYNGLAFGRGEVIYAVAAMSFALLIIAGGFTYFKREPEHTGEYISLILFSLTGAVCMIGYTDLFMFFIGLEILSIPVYVLAGSKKKDLKSSEAGMKYFFTGAFATGILLFGTAWVYGATGTFDLRELSSVLAEGTANGPLLFVGILMMMASFLFKVGAAPFHFWGPDVYAGSPNIITGYMASVVKMAGLYAFLKLFTYVFAPVSDVWSGALFGMIVLTMFVGNLSALRQTKFKRLLAYSSISNAGYALMAPMIISDASLFNLWVYLLGYGFAVIALIVISVIVNDESDDIESYKGIGRKNPWIGVVLILSVLSLAGVPPLAGFFGKYMVFSSAFASYPILVILAVINSGIGVFYYLRFVMVALSSEDAEQAPVLKPCILQWGVLVICALGLLLSGYITL